MKPILTREKWPKIGDFPTYIMSVRGPSNIPHLVTKAQNLEHFRTILTQNFTSRGIRKISTRTLAQAKTRWWHIYRKGLITGTLCSRVVNQAKKNVNNPKLNKSISKFHTSLFTTEAMLWGTSHENAGIHAVYNFFRKSHSGVQIHRTGLIIYPKLPILGGSPDAMMTCECCNRKCLIEIKAPFRLQNGIANWPILEYLTSEKTLRKTHSHYSQIQTYLGITETKIGYFAVWAPDGAIIIEIKFDESYFLNIVKSVEFYYFNHYLPTFF